MLEIHKKSKWNLLGAIHLKTSATERRNRLDARRRTGDDPQSEMSRQKDWNTVTAPLLEHYRKRGELITIEADGPTKEITQKLLHMVRSRQHEQWKSLFPPDVQNLLKDTRSDGCQYTSKPNHRVIRYGSVFVKIGHLLKHESQKLKWAEEHFPLPTPQLLMTAEHDGLDFILTKKGQGQACRASTV